MAISDGLLNTESGNAVFVAMDHGIGGVKPGFENPKTTLDRVLNADPDGVLIGRNFARKFQDALEAKENLKTVVGADFIIDSVLPGGAPQDIEIQDQVFDVEDVMSVHADGIKALLIFGREDPSVLENNYKYVARLSKRTAQYGIPLVVEPVLWGKMIDKEDKLNAKLLANACRIAFELGADVIKAAYPGDQEAFAKMVENSPVPILILGGPPISSEEEVLRMIKEAMEVGARGVFFGRNVWTHHSPDKMVEAMKRIVHEHATVEEALGSLSV